MGRSAHLTCTVPAKKRGAVGRCSHCLIRAGVFFPVSPKNDTLIAIESLALLKIDTERCPAFGQYFRILPIASTVPWYTRSSELELLHAVVARDRQPAHFTTFLVKGTR